MNDDLSYENLLRKGSFTPKALALGEAHLRKIVKDSEFQSRIRPKQFKQWVGGLCDVVENIVVLRNAHFSDNAIFWLMLFELMKEGKGYIEGGLQMLEYVDVGKLRPEYRVIFDREKRELAILRSIETKYSEEELIYIEYKRNCSAHIFQGGYSLRLSKQGELIETHGEVSLDKVMEIAETQVRRFGSETGATIDYARRVKDEIGTLVRLC